MPITFFGVSPNPADNGTSGVTNTIITPPINMLIGDLIIVHCTQRGNTAWSVGTAAGQVWEGLGANTGTANVSVQTFWARFNGSWSANPSFQNAGATNTTVVMLVFRPSAIGYAWNWTLIADNNLAAATVNTIPSTTTTNNSTVTIGIWSTADDNTWGTLTGAGWSKTGLSAQYRNLAGQDSSSTFAYYIATSPVTVPAVSQTQLTLGADATFIRRITFFEISPINTKPNFLSFFNQ